MDSNRINIPRKHIRSDIETNLSFKPLINHNKEKKRKILLVDDDYFNLTALKALIQKAEENLYSRLSKKEIDSYINPLQEEQSIIKIVETKMNGREAVDKIKEAYIAGNNEYALILMDCSMPVLDGYQACD